MIERPVADQHPTPRVLVVDDSPTVLSLLQAALEAHHLEVQTASDGVEGLEKIRLFSPHLIVPTASCRGWMGVRPLARVKEDPATRGIPVIMLSRFPTIQDPPDKFSRRRSPPSRRRPNPCWPRFAACSEVRASLHSETHISPLNHGK